MIYKILTIQDWETHQTNPSWLGTEFDEETGFIHFATQNQIQGVIKKFFQTEDQVAVIAFEEDLFGTDLVFESNRPGGDIYPHVYTSINMKNHSSVEIISIKKA